MSRSGWLRDHPRTSGDFSLSADELREHLALPLTLSIFLEKELLIPKRPKKGL
jgi:hypothetical protein